jgi:hypothetical protein
MEEEFLEALRVLSKSAEESQHAIAAIGAVLTVIVSYLRIQDAVFAEYMPDQLQRALGGAQGSLGKAFAEEIVKAARGRD